MQWESEKDSRHWLDTHQLRLPLIGTSKDSTVSPSVDDGALSVRAMCLCVASRNVIGFRNNTSSGEFNQFSCGFVASRLALSDLTSRGTICEYNVNVSASKNPHMHVDGSGAIRLAKPAD
jgi:hypothetical protein